MSPTSVSRQPFPAGSFRECPVVAIGPDGLDCYQEFLTRRAAHNLGAGPVNLRQEQFLVAQDEFIAFREDLFFELVSKPAQIAPGRRPR